MTILSQYKFTWSVSMKKLFIYLLALLPLSCFAQAQGKSPWTGAQVPSSVSNAPSPAMPNNVQNPQMAQVQGMPNQPQQIISNPGMPNGMVTPPVATDPYTLPPETIEVGVKIIGKLNGMTLYRGSDNKTYMVADSKSKKVVRSPRVAGDASQNSQGQGGSVGFSRSAPPPDLPNAVGGVVINK